MKFLITILSLWALTSCTQPEIRQQHNPLPPKPEQPIEPTQPINSTMKITIGNSTFTATLATNATSAAFRAMLPLTLHMSDFNSNEKVCSLSSRLTTAASNPGTIHPGEIMLYGSSSIVVFYETFSTSYSYTRIGQIDNMAGFKVALGAGSVTLKFE